MDLFTRDDLHTLTQVQHTPCISLFMPTQRVESEFAQNPIRLKNLIREARRHLTQEGHRNSVIDDVLTEVHNLIDNPAFWMRPSDGFAAFISPESSSFYRLPVVFPELVVTGRRFHMKPLFPLFASNNQYYLLALSQNMVRLFQGTHYSINQVEAKEIPASLAKALYYEESQRSLQHHTANVAGGRHDAAFHGHGVQNDDERGRPHDTLRRFFREIDEGILEVLREERAPLVLAGVEYYLPLYRDANRYPYLIDDQIVAGNPENMSLDVLHKRSWDCVEPLFMKRQREDVEAFQRLIHSNGLASTDVLEIIPAAFFSRVETLFVPIGIHQWGRYDVEENLVSLHHEHQPGDDDLLDVAAVQTYLNGGTVHALRKANMPEESVLAATFRFPAPVEATAV